MEILLSNYGKMSYGGGLYSKFNPSVQKRQPYNYHNAGSRGGFSVMKKDPRTQPQSSMLRSNIPSSFVQQNHSNSTLSSSYQPQSRVSVVQPSNSKQYLSSIKQSKQTKFIDYSSKQTDKNDKAPQFRISDPKKSDNSLRSSTRNDQDQKKTIQNKDSNNKELYTPKKIVDNKPVGLVGLSNIGNTCFMNSTLQCLFNLPLFNDYFLEEKHLKQITSNGRVSMAYGKLIKTMRTTSYRSQIPSQLKNAVSSKKSRFMGTSQQDAQQFLTSILQLLSQQLNRSSKPKYKQLTADLSKNTLQQISQEWWIYYKDREDSIVTDLFTGQLLSRVVCGKCNNQSIAFDNTWDFALNFNKYDDGEIKNMLDNFLKQETIQTDYYCAKCKTFRQCKRKLDFFRLPKIIVFQLKRFSYGKYKKQKLNNRVKLRQTLDLTSFVTMSKHNSVKNPIYELVGIVNHSGDIDYGHYTAQCKNPGNKKWYTFNDSSVYDSSSKQNYESSNPYLLFYARKEIV